MLTSQNNSLFVPVIPALSCTLRESFEPYLHRGYTAGFLISSFNILVEFFRYRKTESRDISFQRLRLTARKFLLRRPVSTAADALPQKDMTAAAGATSESTTVSKRISVSNFSCFQHASKPLVAMVLIYWYWFWDCFDHVFGSAKKHVLKISCFELLQDVYRKQWPLTWTCLSLDQFFLCFSFADSWCFFFLIGDWACCRFGSWNQNWAPHIWRNPCWLAMGDGDHKMFPVSEDLQDSFNFMTGKTIDISFIDSHKYSHIYEIPMVSHKFPKLSLAALSFTRWVPSIGRWQDHGGPYPGQGTTCWEPQVPRNGDCCE